MPSLWPLTLYAVAAVSYTDDHRPLDHQMQFYAQKACEIVWRPDASPEKLMAEVYLPVSQLLVGELRKVMTTPLPPEASEKTTLYTANTPLPQEKSPEDVQADEPLLLANAAGSMADLITERYRNLFRRSGQSIPMLVTFRSPGEDGQGNLNRISRDVQRYCNELGEAGVTILFPPLDGQR